MIEVKNIKNVVGVSLLTLLLYSCGSTSSGFKAKKSVDKFSKEEVANVNDSIFERKDKVEQVEAEIAEIKKNITEINDSCEVKAEVFDQLLWAHDYEFTDKELTELKACETDFFADGESVEIDLDELAKNGTYPFLGIFSSNYGLRHGRMHYGIDISARNGAKNIRAIDSGVVRFSRYLSGYGNTIVIRHANGLESVYGHCQKSFVKSGDVVQAGDVIAYVGSTGRSTAKHLHFEYRVNGAPIDPNFLLEVKDNSFKHGKVYVHRFEKRIVVVSNIEDRSKVIVKKYHKIKSGDTLSRISINYGVPIKELCRLNNITTKTILRIGRSLRVA